MTIYIFEFHGDRKTTVTFDYPEEARSHAILICNVIGEKVKYYPQDKPENAIIIEK